MKQSQLLKVQVNGEVKVLAVAIIKKVNPFNSSCYMLLLNQNREAMAVVKSKQYGTKKIFKELLANIKQAIKNKTVLILNDFDIEIINVNNYVLFENRILNIAEFCSYCEIYNANNMNDVKKNIIKKYYDDIQKQIKKVNKNAYITFDFEKFGAVKIIQKSKVGESFDKTLAVISCNEIKQVSYTLYDVVSDNLQKFAKATHDLSFEL